MATFIVTILPQGDCGDGERKREGWPPQFLVKKTERGLAISILTIPPARDGEMASLHSSYSSLGDGEMAASILLILLQGMGRWPPPL